jgi:hypothetical protein
VGPGNRHGDTMSTEFEDTFSEIGSMTDEEPKSLLGKAGHPEESL